MSTICSTDCGAAAALNNYYDPCDEVTRQSGGECVILERCDHVFTDITDAAEWTTAIAAGDIFKLPVGKWQLPEPSVNLLEDATGCGRDIDQSLEYTLPFTTPFAARDSTDFVMWKQIFKDKGSWRVIPKSCDDMFYMSDPWFDNVINGATAPTDKTAGMTFSFAVPPHEIREGTSENIVQWAFTMTIKTSELLCAASLPGVPAVL